MLVQSQMNRFAHQLLQSRSAGQMVPPLTDAGALTVEDGYDIAKHILDVRIAQGEVPVGRKIGFTNRTLWPKYGVRSPVSAPIWAPIFDTTVRYADHNHGLQSLALALQPRMEPEIVFMLGRAPSAQADLAEIADCIEWMAHGIEIAVCPFPDWRFEVADAIAAFGLHGTLIIGERRHLVGAMRRHLESVLAESSVSLSRSGGNASVLSDAGFGTDVLDGPIHALLHLHRLLLSQPQFQGLKAGEIITTGTWTDAHPVAAGETWSTAFAGVSLPGMTLSFV